MRTALLITAFMFGGVAYADIRPLAENKGEGTGHAAAAAAEPAAEQAHPSEHAAPVAAEHDDHGDHAAPPGAMHGKGQDEAHAEHEEAEPKIYNWFSWDYGPNAKDPNHKNWPPPFGFAILNFLVFIGLIVKFAGKPLKDSVANRHDKIARELDEATRLHKEAEAQLKQYQTKLSALDGEISALIGQIRAEGEAEKARLMNAAKEQAERLKIEAQKQIQNEIEAARRNLRVAVIDAAIQAAEKIIREQINPNDQRGLAERFVNDVEQGKGQRRSV